MPFLAGDNLTKFTRYLTDVESADKRSNGILTDWERMFVENIREKFNSREDAEDCGIAPWQPSTNQWNTLHGIWSKL